MRKYSDKKNAQTQNYYKDRFYHAPHTVKSDVNESVFMFIMNLVLIGVSYFFLGKEKTKNKRNRKRKTKNKLKKKRPVQEPSRRFQNPEKPVRETLEGSQNRKRCKHVKCAGP